MAIWILLGVLISIYSCSKKKAMLNVFSFCIGMLITYYFVAYITRGVYSTSYIIGWIIFALCSPIFAYFAWMTKEKGLLPKIISFGIILVSILSSIIFSLIKYTTINFFVIFSNTFKNYNLSFSYYTSSFFS